MTYPVIGHQHFLILDSINEENKHPGGYRNCRRLPADSASVQGMMIVIIENMGMEYGKG
jgi:hypothetical protein